MRNDEVLQEKWNLPRKLFDEFTRYEHATVVFTGPGRTDQSQANDCDVNYIIKQYRTTGVLKGSGRQGLYADFSQAPDLATAHEIISRANEQFASLNAFTRLKFDNDPAKFLEFVANPKNGEELIKMGLATRPPKTDTDRVVEAIRASGKVLNPPSQPSPTGKAPKGKEE